MHTGSVLPYSAYRQLPEDDPNRYEMLWGNCMWPPHHDRGTRTSSATCSSYCGRMSALVTWGRSSLASTKILPGIDVYRDEVNYVTTAQIPLLDEEQPTRLVPPLVVEILSPSTAHTDCVDKRRWYAELGVLEYWLVDCDARSVEVIDQRTGEARTDDPVRSAVLPDLVVPLQRVFG